MLSLIAIGLSAGLATAEGGEQNWLFSVEGVLEAEVGLEAGTAKVRALAGTSPEAIVAAISAAGNYRVELKED